MKHDNLSITLPVPEDVTINVDGREITVSGPQGEVTKTLTDKRVALKDEDEGVTLSYEKATKTEKRLLYSNASIVRNAIHGATEGFTYQMKICSGHFPMTVQVQNNEFVVKNFIGESVPRKLSIAENVDVNIDGDDITITSPDKVRAGQTAGSIEELCKRPGFDKRIFQDGIYITEKPEKLSQKR